MPIYEYRCAKCGDFEVMQKITEKALRKCPTCKGKVAKLLSNSAFQLKGTGWYVTDYAGKGRSGSSESKSESAASSETSKASDSSTGSTASEGGKSEGKKAKSGDKGSAPSSSPVT